MLKSLKWLDKNYFSYGNVSVDGLRGTGKDILFSNIVARRKKPYISNIDYKCKDCEFIPLDLKKLDVSNTYKNFISGDINKFIYSYPENIDIFISDCGIYLPSNFNNNLDKDYQGLLTFQALSRQIANCNVHTNAQNLERVWNKMREQSELYIKTVRCKVLFSKLVILDIRLYDKYQSCIDNVLPWRPIPVPFFNRAGQRELIKAKNVELKRDFVERNGYVHNCTLIFMHKSDYDTRYFKSLLRGLENEKI